MKLIIAGSRVLTQAKYVDLIDDLIKIFDLKPTEIVSGCAKGIDSLGEIWALENSIPIKKFPANWDTFGKLAGPRRNQQMADYADALLVIFIPGSRGSLDMLARAKINNLKTYPHMVELKDGKI